VHPDVDPGEGVLLGDEPELELELELELKAPDNHKMIISTRTITPTILISILYISQKKISKLIN
jgi:hypothetical protein